MATYLRVLILLAFLFSSLGFAGERKINPPFEFSNKVVPCLVSYQNNQSQIFKRGCCSHHKGVCGCKNGKVLCCDGTLSPTCRC